MGHFDNFSTDNFQKKKEKILRRNVKTIVF